MKKRTAGRPNDSVSFAEPSFWRTTVTCQWYNQRAQTRGGGPGHTKQTQYLEFDLELRQGRHKRRCALLRACAPPHPDRAAPSENQVTRDVHYDCHLLWILPFVRVCLVNCGVLLCSVSYVTVVTVDSRGRDRVRKDWSFAKWRLGLYSSRKSCSSISLKNGRKFFSVKSLRFGKEESREEILPSQSRPNLHFAELR